MNSRENLEVFKFNISRFTGTFSVIERFDKYAESVGNEKDTSSAFIEMFSVLFEKGLAFAENAMQVNQIKTKNILFFEFKMKERKFVPIENTSGQIYSLKAIKFQIIYLYHHF